MLKVKWHSAYKKPINSEDSRMPKDILVKQNFCHFKVGGEGVYNVPGYGAKKKTDSAGNVICVNSMFWSTLYPSHIVQ